MQLLKDIGWVLIALGAVLIGTGLVVWLALLLALGRVGNPALGLQ